jgi:hypothetical protein
VDEIIRHVHSWSWSAGYVEADPLRAARRRKQSPRSSRNLWALAKVALLPHTASGIELAAIPRKSSDLRQRRCKSDALGSDVLSLSEARLPKAAVACDRACLPVHAIGALAPLTMVTRPGRYNLSIWLQGGLSSS